MDTPVSENDSKQLRVLKHLYAGDIIALDLSEFQDLPQNQKKISERLAHVAQWFKFLCKDKSVAYPMKEILKNAFYHGNKMDLTLPVYIHFNKEQELFVVVDCANSDSSRIGLASHFFLTGEEVGLGMSKINAEIKLDIGNEEELTYVTCKPARK